MLEGTRKLFQLENTFKGKILWLFNFNMFNYVLEILFINIYNRY